MTLLVMGPPHCFSHSDLPELARDLFAPALEREKLLRFWIETS
jgi:hypothetical protein